MTQRTVKPYQVLDLFSGIGGFSLGLERAGMKTVAFCEQDGYARRVLHKHWPDVWLYEDIRTLTAKRLRHDGIEANVVCGGFPCQDISTAGKGAGIEGERSGLWSEMLRVIKEVKPVWVIAENVPALRSRGADKVLGDLERAGYTPEPIVVGAVHAGANHRRQRVWIVAHAKGIDRRGRPEYPQKGARGNGGNESLSPCSALAHASIERLRVESRRSLSTSREERSTNHAGARDRPSIQVKGQWAVEPNVGRVADGVPFRVDRLRCLGNAVVPQIPEMIGRWIMSLPCP